MILDEVERMRRLDKLGVTGMIEKFPEMCEKGMIIGEQFCRRLKMRKPRKIVFCAMGGSAISSEIIKDMFPDREILIVKDYNLPEYVDKDWLAILASYSGDTEETLSAYEQAVKRKLQVIGISSGGKLERAMKARRQHHIKVPGGSPPRYATGYTLFALLTVLTKLKFIKPEVSLKEVIKDLKETREEIRPGMPLRNNMSKRIAYKLKHTIPVIQATGPYEAIAYRAKTEFNENTKIPSFNEIYPEMNHNGILGWQKPNHLTKRFSILLIRDEGESVKIRKRIEFTKMLLRRSCDSITELWSFYPSKMSRMLSIMYILDFASVYLGFLYGNDPGENVVITELKRVLKGKGEE
jgi:glucose/mannose-6-phosphate isomerase